MSSTGLPTLTIDIAARRGDRVIVLTTLALVLLAVLATDFSLAASIAMGVLLFLGIGLGFYAIGWLPGDRRFARLVCQHDGRWILYEAGGRTVDAELSPASRVSGQALWLRWSGLAMRPLVLFAGDVGPDDFRRLLVRLRLAPFPHRDDEHDVA